MVKAMTGKSKSERVFQRASGWCEDADDAVPNTSLSCCPNDACPVGLDGSARYSVLRVLARSERCLVRDIETEVVPRIFVLYPCQG